MSAQAGVGILASHRLSDCVSDWIPLGSRICMLNIKVLDWSLCLLPAYAPNATSEFQAFVDEVNHALLRVSPTKSTVLMGEFNAHVGTETDTRKGVIGKHGVTGLNENARYLLQLCCSNGFRIMNTFFQHREVHKYTLDLFKKRGVFKCEEVRTFSHFITSKTITYQFSVGFINVYRSRKAIFSFQDL